MTFKIPDNARINEKWKFLIFIKRVFYFYPFLEDTKYGDVNDNDVIVDDVIVDNDVTVDHLSIKGTQTLHSGSKRAKKLKTEKPYFDKINGVLLQINIKLYNFYEQHPKRTLRDLFTQAKYREIRLLVNFS